MLVRQLVTKGVLQAAKPMAEKVCALSAVPACCMANQAA